MNRFPLEPIETASTTSMSIAVRIASSRNDCHAAPLGAVPPSVSLVGKRNATVEDAASAPSSCATTYPGRARVGNRRASQKPIDTAGLRCAPLASPKA